MVQRPPTGRGVYALAPDHGAKVQTASLSAGVALPATHDDLQLGRPPGCEGRVDEIKGGPVELEPAMVPEQLVRNCSRLRHGVPGHDIDINRLDFGSQSCSGDGVPRPAAKMGRPVGQRRHAPGKGETDRYGRGRARRRDSKVRPARREGPRGIGRPAARGGYHRRRDHQPDGNPGGDDEGPVHNTR